MRRGSVEPILQIGNARREEVESENTRHHGVNHPKDTIRVQEPDRLGSRGKARRGPATVPDRHDHSSNGANQQTRWAN